MDESTTVLLHRLRRVSRPDLGVCDLMCDWSIYGRVSPFMLSYVTNRHVTEASRLLRLIADSDPQRELLCPMHRSFREWRRQHAGDAFIPGRGAIYHYDGRGDKERLG